MIIYYVYINIYYINNIYIPTYTEVYIYSLYTWFSFFEANRIVIFMSKVRIYYTPPPPVPRPALSYLLVLHSINIRGNDTTGCTLVILRHITKNYYSRVLLHLTCLAGVEANLEGTFLNCFSLNGSAAGAASSSRLCVRTIKREVRPWKEFCVPLLELES